jgi:hypothetical protein
MFAKYLSKWRLKNAFRRPIKQSDNYIPHPIFEQGIEDAILNDNCGVYVLWGNFDKNSTLRHVALKLQEKYIISGVLGITCNDTWKEYESLQEWLYSNLPIHKQKYPKPLGQYIDSPQRVLLFIDQFDKLMAHPKCKLFTESLAEDSCMTKVYTVVILVTNKTYYNEILSWNFYSKIRPVLFE